MYSNQCSSLEVNGVPTLAVIINRPAGVVWGADSGANERKVSVAVSWSEEPVDGERLSASDLTRFVYLI